MERFVQFILAGGVTLVVGLWLWRVFGWRTPTGGLGVGLALLGCIALGVGIRRELSV